MINQLSQRKSLMYQNNYFFAQAAGQFIKSGSVVGKVSKAVSSRAGLYRLIIVLASVHIISTYASTFFQDKMLTMSVTDYISNNFIKNNSTFQVFGILKLGSIQLQKGSLDTKFTITDFKNEVEVYYNGLAKFEFKEGETILLTAYCPDQKNKNKLIAIEYMTKHSMEVQNWKDKIGQSRENYGLYSSKQQMSQ